MNKNKSNMHKQPPASALLQLAIEHHQSGRLLEAEKLYRQLLSTNPAHPDALHLLGLASHQSGNHDTAIDLINKAISASPSASMYSNLGAVYQATGEFTKAEKSYQKSLSLNPADANTHFNLAITLKHLARPLDAINSYQKALGIRPDFAEAHYNLGNAFKELNSPEQAVFHYQQAITLKENHFEALNNLGLLLLEMKKPEEAEHCFIRALAINHQHADVHLNLGNAKKAQRNIKEAISCCQAAISIDPNYTEAHHNLGVLLMKQEKLDEAISCFTTAISINPAFLESYLQLVAAYAAQHDPLGAKSVLDKLISIKPDYAEAHCDLGSVFHMLGKREDALEQYNIALHLKPDFDLAHSALIFAMDMHPGLDTATLQQERRKWGQLHANSLLDTTLLINARNPSKKLRVGYVSFDFKAHSAAYVFSSMLMEFDRDQFEVYIYSNSSSKDTYTRLLENNVTCWRTIYDLSNDETAQLIRQDEIDILVDLSGHSRGNRLLVFARKPAPIQITAWGYIGGTGMQSMDYFFADAILVPPEEKHLYTEEVRYLPTVACYYPFEPFPTVNTLPALAGRGITFGSFNRLVKVSDESFRLWAQVLSAVPNSRMILKTPELDDEHTLSRVRQAFANVGVAAERVTLLGRTTWTEHMAAFNKIDVALDPFPHGGGVTAYEGIMMGVPMVTLRCPTIPGRISAAILTPLGLADWVAESPEEYVSIAVQKTRDLAALAVLRRQLRKMMTSSLVGDPKAYTKVVEQEYRTLWQQWCKQ